MKGKKEGRKGASARKEGHGRDRRTRKETHLTGSMELIGLGGIPRARREEPRDEELLK